MAARVPLLAAVGLGTATAAVLRVIH
jgi:hypothetical protein